jgi:hypothetical protein
MDAKKVIETKYKYFISCLRNVAKEIDKIKGVNNRFTELQLSFYEALEKQIKLSKQQMEEALNGTVWDNLVIAFFGETNAGKSTIIETFRILFDKSKEKGEDGLIVGDGRNDYTQDYNEYKMYINNHQFTLIDVPGIEGNETSEFKEDIQRALHQAHCIFYVQGNNKQPDTATAEKIKNYLSDWVSVYSIYNVRGGVFNYDEEEERVKLYTEEVKKTETLIDKTFKEILGNRVYKGNITIQALLALCAKASFSEKRQDLVTTQQELMECFGSNDSLFNFSEMTKLISLVEEKANDFQKEIIESNKQKLTSLAKQSYNNINYIIKTNKEKEKELQDGLKAFKQDVSDIFSRTKTQIEADINAKYRALKSNILMEIYSVIDSNSEEKEQAIQIIIRDRSRSTEQEIKNCISINLNVLNQKLEQKRKDLEGLRISFVMMNRVTCFDSNIDVKESLKEMDLSLEDVGLVAAFAISSIFSPIAGIVLGVSYFLKKWIFGDGGKSKAKEKARKTIEEAFKKDTTKHELINNISRNLDKVKNDIYDKIKEENNNIHDLGEIIDSAKEQMKNYVKTINNKKYGNI